MIRKFILFILLICSISSFSQEYKLTKKNLVEFKNELELYLKFSELSNSIKELDYLIVHWAKIDKVPNTPKKVELVKLQNEAIPEILKEIDNLAVILTPYEKRSFIKIKYMVDTLKTMNEFVMDKLNSFKAYDDFLVLIETYPMVEEGGDIIDYSKLLVIEIDKLKELYSQKYNRYLPQSEKQNDIAIVDTKVLSVESFIFLYGLTNLVDNAMKFQIVYDFYSKDELDYACNFSAKKSQAFYKKYNTLLMLLMAK